MEEKEWEKLLNPSKSGVDNLWVANRIHDVNQIALAILRLVAFKFWIERKILSNQLISYRDTYQNVF